MTERVIQAYRKTPWRAQIQWIGYILLVLVSMALIAGLYLAITAETATAGVFIQNLDEEKKAVEFEIASLQSQIASLTSVSSMKTRAEELGYKVNDSESIHYLIIPGYTGRQTVILAPPPGPNAIGQSVIKSTYTLSLWEWLYDGILEMQKEYTSGQS